MSTPSKTGPSRIEDAALLTGQGRFLEFRKAFYAART